jgi:hypothetical protein
MKEFILSNLSKPKVRMVLCGLLSIILAIALFGDPTFQGATTATSAATTAATTATTAASTGASGVAASTAASTAVTTAASTGASGVAATTAAKYFVATLSPMAAGFAVLPFIFSVMGFFIFARQYKKEYDKEKQQKADNRYIFIETKQKELDNEYNNLCEQMKVKIESKIKDNERRDEMIEAVNTFITNTHLKQGDNSVIANEASSSGYFKYKDIFNYCSIDKEVEQCREITAERDAFSDIAKEDLKSLKTTIKTIVPDTRARNTAFAKLRAANDKSTTREA